MKRILVIAHDAGGANILASLWGKYRRQFRWDFVLAGPAATIFRRHGLRTRRPRSPRAALRSIRPHLALTGTGWQTPLENDGIRDAKALGIPTFCYLDHWINFRERFGYPDAGWRANLPDYLLVGDRRALQIALRDRFPRTRLVRTENPYLHDMMNRRGDARRPRQGRRILFISEPISPRFWHARAGGGKSLGLERRALATLVGLMERPELAAHALRVRLHPCEPRGKYAALLRGKGIKVNAASSLPLEQDCRDADIAVGMGSSALLIAAILGCRALSFDPLGRCGKALPSGTALRCSGASSLLQAILDGKRPSDSNSLQLFREPFDHQIARCLKRTRR